jgi:hypothetical protein
MWLSQLKEHESTNLNQNIETHNHRQFISSLGIRWKIQSKIAAMLHLLVHWNSDDIHPNPALGRERAVPAITRRAVS